MGVVDLAVGEDGRPVAVKRLLLHGSVHDMGRARQRIRREAEALQQLDHPNIVRLLEVHDNGDEIVLVMPYLSGGTLADQVRAHGPLTADQVRALAPPLLGALAAAHRQGVVHRDIKPANVLFDMYGRPYLADFGVASLRNATSGLTASGVVLGTPEYMAPEQARGEPATPASDVFSLGATLAYAATGTPPFGRGDPRVLMNLAAKGRILPLPTTMPADLRRFLGPMLERQDRKRPTAAAALGGPNGTRVLHLDGRRPRRRRLWRGAAVGAAFGTIATAGALLVVATRPDPTPTNTATRPAAVVPSPTSAPCEDQPYRPCGAPAAPFTDGVKCLDDHADYDGGAANGCEAAPDAVDGHALTGPLTANLVPANDIDRYPFHVDDSFDLLCQGEVRVTLTAPKGASMRLDVLRGNTILATTTSADGRAATVKLPEPSCLGDDTTDLTARVAWDGTRRTGASYHLERTGSY